MKIGKPKYTGKHVSAAADTAAPSRSSAKPASEEKPAKAKPVKAPAAKPARRSAEAKQSAPKAERAARAPLPKGVKIAGIVLAVLILIIGSGALFVNAKLNRLNRSVDTNVEKPVNGATVSDDFSANVEGLEVRSGGGELPDGDLFSDKNIVNILLLGTDMKIPGTNDPGRCDCTMICSLNKATGEVKLIGFERAIGVPIPGYEDELLTYAYQYGAGPFMVETIEKCFNVDLAGYVHVGFESFPQVINAIGGIEERQVARISVCGNEVAADSFRRVLRGGFGGVRDKFGNPFCLGSCRTADAAGGTNRFDSGARKVIELEIFFHRAGPERDVRFVPDLEIPGFYLLFAEMFQQSAGKRGNEFFPRFPAPRRRVAETVETDFRIGGLKRGGHGGKFDKRLHAGLQNRFVDFDYTLKMKGSVRAHHIHVVVENAMKAHVLET